MEKYRSYELEEFLLDEDFKSWVASGALLSNSVWEKLLNAFPEKTHTLRGYWYFKRLEKTSLSDFQYRSCRPHPKHFGVGQRS
jgi:hypothetical protein